VTLTDGRTSNKRTQGLICVGTVAGNAVSILILEWERRSHTSHCLVIIGVTFYVTVVSRHNHF